MSLTELSPRATFVDEFVTLGERLSMVLGELERLARTHVTRRDLEKLVREAEKVWATLIDTPTMMDWVTTGVFGGLFFFFLVLFFQLRTEIREVSGMN